MQEHRIRRHDGEYRWFLVRAEPVRDEAGNLTMFGSATDIHAQRTMMETLLENEEKYRTLFESIDEGFYFAEAIFDEAGRCVDIRYLEENPAAERMTGQSFHGRLLSEMGAYEQYWRDMFGQVARTGEPIKREEFAAPDGIWYEFYAFRPPRAKQNQLAVIFRDVTVRRRTLEALRASENLRRIAVAGGRMGTWRWDHREGLIRGDAVFMRLWGFPPSDAALPLARFTDRMSPGGAAEIAALVSKAADAGEEFDGQVEVVAGPTAGRWVRWRGRAEAESPWILNGVSFDVTDARRAELSRVASEGRRAFLLRLSDALRPLSDSAEMELAAMRLLGEELGADRAFFATIGADGESWGIQHDYADGLRSLAGKYPMSNFQRKRLPQWRAGQMSSVIDSEAEPTFDAADRAAYAAFGTRAAIGVPLVKGGRVSALLSVNQSGPREWTEAELELTREAAERTWASIERARAEETLRYSEERFRTMADNAPVLIWETNENGATSVNGHYLDFFGVGVAEIEGMGWARFLHPDDVENYLDAYIEGYKNRKSYSHECRFRRADGQYRWLRNSGGPVGASRYVGCSLDVTDNFLAQQALRASEERLRLALVAARMGTWRWQVDADRHERDANLNQLLGRPAEPSAGPLDDFLASIHPADRGRVEEGFYASVRHGHNLSLEFRVPWPDGTVRWLRDQGDVFGGPEGRYLAGACVDVTDLKEAEVALQQANERLEARVAERTSDLEVEMTRRKDLTRRLSTAQEDERRRVSRDLHDSIGQLMAALSLAFRALETAGPLPPTAAGKLAEANRIVEVLGHEVHGLAVRLRPTSLDDIGLEASLGQMVGDWSRRTGIRADLSTVGLGPGRLTPEVETAIYRIVQEALTNVAKHAGASLVSVVVGRPTGHATAVIEDDGDGFDPDAVTQGRLGLLGVRERAEMVGGTLTIESGPGAGTTLAVRIPITEGT